MNKNPKYDMDLVPLWYLKNVLEKETTENNKKITSLPKNYSSPPAPPYYAGSLLVLSGNIYRCTKSREIGSFTMSDWTCVLDTTEYNELVVKSLDSVVDMLDVQQYDHKLETFLSNSDPAEEWQTDLEKEQHLYDFWKTYADGTPKTYIYNKFATNPITYGWTIRDCPEEIWDTTDGHKNMFGLKPTTYQKHDMWRIENDLDSSDLPDGCSPGEWAVCIKANTEYDKSDWTNKLIYIDLDELAKRVYSKNEIDRQRQVLEDEITTSITRSENSILAQVSQTYATQETTNYLVEGLGNVSDTVDVHTSSLAELQLTVGKIQSEISDFADITASSEDYGSVTIENVAESEPVSIKIHPTNNQDISYLYPRINLYPSQALYLKTRTLLFETNGFSYRYELPCDLLYYDDENYDEFEFDYNSQKVMVSKKVGVDAYGVNYLLSEPYTKEYAFPTIELQPGDYTITLLGHTYAHIFVRCLVSNIYTDQFPTYAQMKTAITQTAGSINQMVSLKVGKTEIISSINQTAEAYTIDASKINITGVLTAINNDTSTTINGNKITTGTITADQIASSTITADKIQAGSINSSKIATGTITADNISSGAITSDKLSSNSITANKIASNAVTSDKIQSSAITTDKLAANAITASKIASNAITTDKLSANCITSAKISSSAITSEKISSNAITASKIASGTITGDKIAAGAITASKVASDIITTNNFSAQNINASQITSGTINASRIAAGSISASKLYIPQISAISTDLGAITAGSIDINGYFSVNRLGGTQISTEGGGFFSTRKSTHPYISALNMANGYNFGINFVTGENQESVGSIRSYIYQDEDYELNFHGYGGIDMACNGSASISFYNKIDLNAGGASVWAQGNNLSSGRVKTDSGSASSRILKQNIIDFVKEDYKEAYKLLNELKMSSYDYKYNQYSDNHQYGFIIDDVEKLDNADKFFRFNDNYARVNGLILDSSIVDEEGFDEKNLPEDCIHFKKYDSDVLDKFMLTCLKALQFEIEKLKVGEING